MTDIKATGLSLNIKFFLLTALIIILLIGVTLWFSSRKATELANQAIREGLDETISVFETFQKDRYTILKLTNSIIAQNPYVQAYVDESDSTSILDLARQYEAELKSDFIIVTDPEGVILARTDKPASTGDSVADTPLIAQALEGEEVAGLWQEDQNLYNAVALPVITGDQLKAVMAVGYAVNDTLAVDIKNLTHSETSFFLTPKGKEPFLVATTARGMSNYMLSALKNGAGKKEPSTFQLGSEKYVGVFKELQGPDGQPIATLAAFRSLDRELAGSREFQKSILLVGLGVMLLAFLLSFLGAQQITGPLRRLTNAINEVKEGNYDVPIEVDAGGEVGVLAKSFKKLLDELQEKASLVQYLSKQATMIGETQSTEAMMSSDSTQQQVTAGGTPVTQPGSTTMAAIGPGTVIGNRYEVQSVLGAGGRGVVLKARDRQLDEVVALKMLKGEVFMQDPGALERFKLEIKLARRITHRHVIKTYDYSENGNYYCISMEYIKGITLKQLIRQRGSIPLKIALQIGKQISSALDAAHEKGVVHRDIKPQNILLESTGDAKVMDFGIARLSDVKGMTHPGTVMGTPDYMSPEQAQGLEVDHRTDIYSTGVVLYEMFTGELPFTGHSPLVVLNKHISEDPPAPRSINAKIPIEVERVLLKAMSKDPAERYQQVSDLYKDLDTISDNLPAPVEKSA